MTLAARHVTVKAGNMALLQHISLEIAPGEIVAVVGPNGAGKSTLLNVLAGDFPATAGCIHYAGTPLEELAIEERARLRSVVAAPPQVAFDFSVADVVAMGWLYGKRFGQETRCQALTQVLEQSAAVHLAQRTFATLSSGEQQRAQFARALLQLWRADSEPRWLLLDEPTANLDIAHGVRMLDAVRRQAENGVGVLAVLHDLNLAVRYAHRVLILQAGRAVACGAPDEVFASELLSRVYDTPVYVEHNTVLDRLVVLT